MQTIALPAYPGTPDEDGFKGGDTHHAILNELNKWRRRRLHYLQQVGLFGQGSASNISIFQSTCYLNCVLLGRSNRVGGRRVSREQIKYQGVLTPSCLYPIHGTPFPACYPGSDHPFSPRFNRFLVGGEVREQQSSPDKPGTHAHEQGKMAAMHTYIHRTATSSHPRIRKRAGKLWS